MDGNCRYLPTLLPDITVQAVLRRKAKQSLAFGQGSKMSFDFDALEGWVLQHVLGSHTQITALTRSFRFAGEKFDQWGPIGGIEQLDTSK